MMDFSKEIMDLKIFKFSFKQPDKDCQETTGDWDLNHLRNKFFSRRSAQCTNLSSLEMIDDSTGFCLCGFLLCDIIFQVNMNTPSLEMLVKQWPTVPKGAEMLTGCSLIIEIRTELYHLQRVLLQLTCT